MKTKNDLSVAESQKVSMLAVLPLNAKMRIGPTHAPS
jgi:hypothetical protein